MIWEIIKYLIFGLVQGFTEPLPISSSGHLVLLRHIFNLSSLNDLSFEILLNFASFLAIVLIFKDDIIELVSSFFSYLFDKEKRKDKQIKANYKYCWLIVLGCVPAGIVGVLFKDYIEKWSNNMTVLGLAFLITALLLFLVRKINGKKKDEDLTVKDAIIIGLFQMFALMPGMSRSGAVLVGCISRGLNRDAALKYAFMLYLPVSLGSFLISIGDLTSISPDLTVPYLIGFIASGVMTYFASHWFFGIVKRGKLAKFSIYLVILGLLVLIFL